MRGTKMANIKLYSVYDVKIKGYTPPFPSHTNGSALRQWSDMINDPKSVYSKHPEDYSLVYVADYDDHTGKFMLPKMPEVIGTGLEYQQIEPTLLSKDGKSLDMKNVEKAFTQARSNNGR